MVVARISLAAAFLTVPAIISLRGRWFLLRRSAAMITAFGLIAIAACCASVTPNAIRSL